MVAMLGSVPHGVLPGLPPREGNEPTEGRRLRVTIGSKVHGGGKLVVRWRPGLGTSCRFEKWGVIIKWCGQFQIKLDGEGRG